jgi:hypothetical protein
MVTAVTHSCVESEAEFIRRKRIIVYQFLWISVASFITYVAFENHDRGTLCGN